MTVWGQGEGAGGGRDGEHARDLENGTQGTWVRNRRESWAALQLPGLDNGVNGMNLCVPALFPLEIVVPVSVLLTS